jgi:hypothetical protein
MSGSGLPSDEVNSYLDSVDWLVTLLRHDAVLAAWGQPSTIAQYSVGGVAAHAAHGVVWLEQVLNDAEPEGLREVTIAEFFGPNRVEGTEDEDPFSTALRAAAERFAQAGAALVIAACTTSRSGLAGLLVQASAERAIPVLRVAGGQVPLRQYLRTRVLEVVVHGDDIACSVPGLEPPDPPTAAVDVCMDVCLELARARSGDLGALRAFTRAERAAPGLLRVL